MLGLTVHDHTYVRFSSFVHPLTAQCSAQCGTQLWASATLRASARALLNFLGKQDTCFRAGTFGIVTFQCLGL